MKAGSAVFQARGKKSKASQKRSQRTNPTARSNERMSELATLFERLDARRAVLLICLVASLAYANSLGGAYVFDDTDQIVDNPSSHSWSNLGSAFATHVWAFRERPETLRLPPAPPYYRPLFTVMLTVEYHLFGLWPQGWHIVSLLLYILCAVGLLYTLL